jgi:hypothetical protein
MEKWLPVLGWEEFYEVSNLGNVRSIKRIGKTKFGNRFYGGDLVKPIKTTTGYVAVNLTGNKCRKQFHIHKLVLEAFVGKAPIGMECCHNNGNRTDARLENLRWDTRINNHADKWNHGTWQGGVNHGNAKLTNEQVKEIKKGNLPIKQLAQMFNVSIGCINKIRYGEAWKHINV